jgi:hypothetical protein
MGVAQLRERYRQLSGDGSRSRNREYLIRRILWMQQALALGGNDFRNRYNALLKRILRCRRCDAAMTRVFQGQHSRTYRHYTCSSAMRKGRATCAHP